VTRRQTAAAAIDRAAIDIIECAEIGRTEIDRIASRKEVAGGRQQLGGGGRKQGKTHHLAVGVTKAHIYVV
jgi:hypothetical protein